MATLPAVVLTAGAGDEGEDLDLLTDAMIENELRSDLDPLQRARGYQAMIDGGLGVRAVAERLGGKTKRSSREKRIKEHLAILALPERLRTLVAEQAIPLLGVNRSSRSPRSTRSSHTRRCVRSSATTKANRTRGRI